MAEIVTNPVEYGAKGDPSQEIMKDTPEDEAEIVRATWKGLEDSRAYKYSQVNPRDWKRYASLYMCNHWDGQTKSWQSTPTIPLTFSAVNAINSVITDNKPQIAVVPREPNDSQIADVLRAVIEWLWEENDCDIKLPSTMLNALIFGNGFWKILWNPAAKKGLGDIQIINVDPTGMFFNPEATSIEDAECIYHVEQMSLRKIEMLWPDKAHLVKRDMKDPDVVVNRPQVSQRPGGGSRKEYAVQTTTGSDVWMYPAGSATQDSRGPKDSATVCEKWELDKESNRWKRTLVAGNVLLEPVELTDFDTPPFVHFMDYKNPWSIWAMGEIQPVENLQYEINKRRGMILDILRFCASPMLVYDPGAGTDLENIVAEPGISIPAEGGPSALSWLLPQMDLGGLFAVNDRDKQDFNDSLGNVDMIQGKRPVGVEAGIALEMLSEAANTRLRLKVRYLEASLRRAGKLIIKFIQKHYTSQRVFRIVGNEFTQGMPFVSQGTPRPMGTQDFFAINQPTGMAPQGVGPDGMPTMAPEYGEGSNFIPPDAEFDVRVGAGSTLPVSRTAKFQQAITLYDRGALDIYELLKAAGWDRYEEVAAKMEQKLMMAQMGGMPPGGGMGGAPTPEDLAMIPETVGEETGEEVLPVGSPVG